MANRSFEDSVRQQFGRDWEDIAMEQIRNERHSPESLAAYLGCGKRILMQRLQGKARLNRCLEPIEKQS